MRNYICPYANSCDYVNMREECFGYFESCYKYKEFLYGELEKIVTPDKKQPRDK